MNIQGKQEITDHIHLTLTIEEAKMLDILLNPYDAGDEGELLSTFVTLRQSASSRTQVQIDLMTSVVNKLRKEIGVQE